MSEYKSIALMCFILLFGMNITSCSDDSCSQSDWIGTYNKIDEDCDNGGTPLFEDFATLFAGSCSNCLSSGSSNELVIDDNCTITQETPLFGDLIYTLDGNILRVSAPLINCSATYEKQ